MGREQQAAAIRAEMQRMEARGRGRRYPQALRAKAIRYWMARRAEGIPLQRIGDELGLPWQTLHRWAKTSPEEPTATAGFEAIQIIETVPSTPHSAIVVHGPCGLRIDGLDLDTLSQLLRRLA